MRFYFEVVTTHDRSYLTCVAAKNYEAACEEISEMDDVLCVRQLQEDEFRRLSSRVSKFESS